MDEGKPKPRKEAECSVKDTLIAFQDLLVSMKLRRLTTNSQLELATAFGGEEEMLQHLINLQEAVQYLQKAPKDRLNQITSTHNLNTIKDGTSPFRVQHRLLEPAIEQKTTTVNIAQLEEAVLVLHAYNRLVKQ
ncbi:MAG: hypothetical protein V1875_05925 [Candidatus Altiarchaeota archaeon]